MRKGIFTALEHNKPVQLNGGDYVLVWRRVLDEMLIALCGTNTSAKEHSERFFNSQPGDIDYYFDENVGEEYQVDLYEEFSEVCSLAGLEPNLVRDTANKIKLDIEQEDKEA